VLQIILWLLFGALVGWIAGIIMKSRGSLVRNIVCGVVGSFVGGYMATFLGIGSISGRANFDIVNVVISIIGACVVIFLARILKLVK
jgi:uncharacterized membrane protein YeaQ/YmgE (transglycosylase-associated protein family)